MCGIEQQLFVNSTQILRAVEYMDHGASKRMQKVLFEAK